MIELKKIFRLILPCRHQYSRKRSIKLNDVWAVTYRCDKCGRVVTMYVDSLEKQ